MFYGNYEEKFLKMITLTLGKIYFLLNNNTKNMRNLLKL